MTGFLLLAILTVAYSASLGSEGVARLVTLRSERQRLGQEAVTLMEQNAELREQIKRLKTDDRFLENIARRELGLVRRGEIVYRFHRPAKVATP